MAAGKTLRLTAHSYDQPEKDEPGAKLTALKHGDVFKALSDGEYKRLTEAGVAEDPDVEQEREHAQLEQRKADLQAERQRIDEQLKATTARK